MCFVAAAEQLNFARAARQRHITAAAFGQRIKQLEQQLNCMLFERSSRSVSLTLEGHRLLPKAQAILQEALSCYEVVHGDFVQPIQLTLGTRFELGMSWVLPSLQELQKEQPNFQVDLYFGSGPDLLEKLKQREVDAIITSAPKVHSTWSAEFLHDEFYLFVASPQLLQEKPFHTPDDAQHHTLFDIDETLPLTRYLTSIVGDMQFANVRRFGAGAAIHHMVRHGQGVAVLPEYIVREDLEKKYLVQLLPEYNLLSDTFRLMFSRNSFLKSYLKSVAAYLSNRPLT